MLDCTGCWNHEKCESRKKKDLVYCFRKNFICRYCGNTDCKNYIRIEDVSALIL